MSYRSVFMSYRTNRVEIVRTFQYNDSASDHFEREPYSVLIRSREEGGGKIFLDLAKNPLFHGACRLDTGLIHFYSYI